MDSDVATISNSRGSKGEVLETEETKGTWWKHLGQNQLHRGDIPLSSNTAGGTPRAPPPLSWKDPTRNRRVAHGDGKLQAALGNDISLKYLGEAGLSLAPLSGAEGTRATPPGLAPTLASCGGGGELLGGGERGWEWPPPAPHQAEQVAPEAGTLFIFLVKKIRGINNASSS